MYTHVCIYVCIYIYIEREIDIDTYPCLRGWQNTVGVVLFEISNSMKPYPLGCTHMPTSWGPRCVLLIPKNLDEAFNRIPPTSHCCLSQRRALACSALCMCIGFPRIIEGFPNIIKES